MKFIDLINKLAREGAELPQHLITDDKTYDLSTKGKYYYEHGTEEENRIAPDSHPNLEIKSWS